MTKKQFVWFAIIMGIYALAMVTWAIIMIVKYT